MELPIGVAYGTDPQAVIDILVGLANDRSEILNDPEPAALFRGFGDSSLDFQLRAWTRGDYVSVSSDLLIGVNNALTDAVSKYRFHSAIFTSDRWIRMRLNEYYREDQRTAKLRRSEWMLAFGRNCAIMSRLFYARCGSTRARARGD